LFLLFLLLCLNGEVSKLANKICVMVHFFDSSVLGSRLDPHLCLSWFLGQVLRNHGVICGFVCRDVSLTGGMIGTLFGQGSGISSQISFLHDFNGSFLGSVCAFISTFHTDDCGVVSFLVLTNRHIGRVINCFQSVEFSLVSRTVMGSVS